MNLTVQISDLIATRITSEGGNLERHALEGLLAEEFRAGRITKRELREALSFAVLNEVDGFLKKRGVFEDTTVEDLQLEVQSLERFGR